MGISHLDMVICRTLASVSHGVDGSQGTKAVPSYIAAEAETAPLPKIVIQEPRPPAPPPRQSLAARLGDLPMRVIYRLVVVGVAVVVAVATGVILLVTRDDSRTTVAAAPEPSGASSVASAGVAPPSGQPSAEPGSVPSAASSEPSSEPASGGVPSAGSDAATPAPTGTDAAVEPASAGSGAPATTPPAPRMKPLEAALADPRIPGVPKNKKLGKLPGRPVKVKRWIKDKRSQIAVARLSKTWRLAKPAPFATRQVLPAVKGAGHRALIVSCPVPIIVQEKLRDTALIAARWTLNHQPKGAKIKSVASQPGKVGKRDAWVLAYEVKYTVKGKKRSSMAAVVLTEVPKHKPALLFVSIPDSQKKRWRDINTVISTLKAA